MGKGGVEPKMLVGQKKRNVFPGGGGKKRRNMGKARSQKKKTKQKREKLEEK